MNKKLYVGNLPFDLHDTALKEMFEQGGRQVASANIITDRETGRSRGFGFVEFENEDDAKSAMEAMNGTEVNGRALVVNEAREQTRGGGGGRGGFGGGGGGRGGRPGGGGGRGNRPPRW